MDRLARYAWGVLGFNLLVILWGAFVRASGSGAGCGAHWPLCNGEVIPRGRGVQTLIEFTHRATSGLALLAVVALAIWAFEARPRGDRARKAAAASLAFMLAEAAVGAGLVLFELVADNATMARALFMAVHLTNTFLLLLSLTLTARWLGMRGGARASAALREWALPVIAGAGLLVVGVSGAVAALGDTLYPAASLGHALEQDLSATSHLLIRLRVLHPLLSVATAVILLILATRLARGGGSARRPAAAVAALAFAQVACGALNVLLLAPIWMQLVHLLLADLLWIAFVLMVDATRDAPQLA